MVTALLVLAVALTVLPAVADPVAEAGPSITDYTGRPVVFEGFGTPDSTQRIILYEWDFEGDGVYDWNSTRTGMCTNRYSEPGDYNATLRVTQFDANRSAVLTDTDTTEVTILSGSPVGRVTSGTTAEKNKEHQMTSSFYDPDGGILEHEWWIDGVLESTDASFKHTFDELGKIEVSLRVTDDEGETAEDELILEVVTEVDEGIDISDYYMTIALIMAIFIVAVVAYVAILRGHRHKEKERPERMPEDTPPIVPEASLTDKQAAPAPRRKPRVVRPERVVLSPEKSKEGEEAVPAAPPKMPCSECGTTLDDEDECAFCKANEEIDEVEKSIRELQQDGYILAKAEEELEAAKSELHVKNFVALETSLTTARKLMDEAIREHERCLTLMSLVDELIREAEDRDLDVTKASNLQKLSKSFMKSGKYPKAIYYAERSRDFLLETLEPFDLDRYFCEHCKSEVGEEDDTCPHCDQDIESGLIRRAKRELGELKRRFGGISRDHEHHTPIAAQLEKADEHVASRSASAAHEHIEMARSMLDTAEGVTPSEVLDGGEGPPEDEGKDGGEGAPEDEGKDGGEGAPEDEGKDGGVDEEEDAEAEDGPDASEKPEEET